MTSRLGSRARELVTMALNDQWEAAGAAIREMSELEKTEMIGRLLQSLVGHLEIAVDADRAVAIAEMFEGPRDYWQAICALSAAKEGGA